MKLNLCAIASFSLSFCCLLLAAFIWHYARSKTHRIWALFNLVVALWGFGNFLAAISPTPEQAMWSWRFCYIPGTYISVVFYHLICSWSEIERPKFKLFAKAFGIVALCLRGMLWAQGSRKLNLLTIAGVIAVIAGGVGAVILAGPGVAAIQQYAAAVDAGRPGLQASTAAHFSQLAGLVFVLSWQTVAAAGFAVWFAGVAFVFTREFRLIRVVTLVAAAGGVVSATGRVLDVPVVAAAGVLTLIGGWFVSVWFLGREFVAMGAIHGSDVLDEDDEEDA